MMVSTPKGLNEPSDNFDRIVETTPLRPRKSGYNISVIAAVQNDENERHKRRSLAQLQKQISSSSGTPITEQPVVADHEIKSHMDICLKMFMENKITTKNAWNIKIIDYMRTFLQSSRVIKDSLQVGSTSLDVGARVYSIRVDDIHSIGLKIASSMAKAATKNADPESGEDAAEPDGNKKKKTPTKKKKKFVSGGVKLTIAKDPSTLLGEIPKIESGFFQTKTNSELSTLDNFLTNRIPMDRSGCKFMLMSKERMWTTQDDEDYTLEKRFFKFKVDPIEKFSLCSEFSNFEVDVWDPDNDEVEKFANANISANNTDLVFDDNGIPMAELDGSVHDIFNEPEPLGYGSSEEDQEQDVFAVLGEVSNIRDLRPSDTLDSNDYSYQSMLQNNKLMTNIWAGPSHWKLKHLQRTTRRFSGVTEKKEVLKKRLKEKSGPINFLQNTGVLIENDPLLKKRNTLKQAETNKLSVLYSQKSLMKSLQTLLVKPVLTYVRRGSEEKSNSNIDNFEVGPYDYANENDSFYCSQNVGNDNGGDTIMDEEEIPIAAQNQAFEGDNLIDLPELVTSSKVAYATRAKKMDMKKLKASVWKILVDDTENDLISDDIYRKKVKSMNFADLYGKLPSIVNKSMKEELSCPLAFISILHLVNEFNLTLTKLGNNFLIDAADV